MTGKAALNPKRLRALNRASRGPGPVIYWMSRDQRVDDNWALLFAQEMALDAKVPLGVVFALDPSYPSATRRSLGFLLRGLAESARDLGEKGIPFFLLEGPPGQTVPGFASRIGAGAVFCDFDPLRAKTAWKSRVAESLACPLLEVDAHNIVPCWAASQKAEYGAYTLRPKLARLLPHFLAEFPPLEKHPFPWEGKVPPIDLEGTLLRAAPSAAVPEVQSPAPGPSAGKRALAEFVAHRLENYGTIRNDPNRDGCSGLSPYLHFGQVSPQRVALEVSRASVGEESRKAFLEELVVRRELSDNLCLYNPAYDRPEGFPAWARETLARHAPDPREYLYSLEALENAATSDPLWNAAQARLARTGRLHGYLRMYWGKRILAWSPSGEEALAAATPWTGGTRTVTRAQPGASAASTTVPGPNGRSSARSGL